MIRVSHIIPLGEYPFFIEANWENVMKTCGVPSQEIDFIFLTFRTISDHLMEGFDKYKKKYNFRIITAPFDTGPKLEHCDLLDWAVKEADIHNTISLQHSDLFWKDNDLTWLKDSLEMIDVSPDFVTLAYDWGRDYTIHSKPIVVIDDCIGLYNRKELIKNDLIFGRGNLGERLQPSPELEKAIQDEQVMHARRDKMIRIGSYMDGGRLMTLEVGLRFPDKTLLRRFYYIHNRVFFKIGNKIRRCGSVLIIDGKLHPMERLGFYSWITSFGYDRDKFQDRIFPWSAFLKFKELLIGKKTEDKKEKYYPAWNKTNFPNTVKFEMDGVKSVYVIRQELLYNLEKMKVQQCGKFTLQSLL